MKFTRTLLSNSLKYLLFIAFVFSGFFVSAIPATAEGERLTVTPMVYDEKAKKRDILKRNISLTNNTDSKLDVYVFVNDIDTEVGEQEFEGRTTANISESLANWIEISRGKIDLEPGQTKQIPFLIHVSVYADPGIHHAQISFGWGSTKIDAQVKAAQEPAASINVEVLDDSKEVLQLGSFLSDKTFFTENVASFSYLFENIGNRAVSPSGEIRIYNRRGEEVGAIGVNDDDAELLPNMTSKLGSIWNSEGKFGRYKAMLDVEYGAKQRGTVQDTIFFWVIPWKKILFIFIVLSAVLAMVVYLLHRRYELYQEFKYAAVPVVNSFQPTPEPLPQITQHPTHVQIPKRQPSRVVAQTVVEPISVSAEPMGVVTLAKRAPAATTDGNVVRLKSRR